MNQVECHPYLSQSKLKEFCEKRGILLTGYSPLGSPDKPFKEENQPEPLLQDTTVQDIAKRNNKSAAQVLLRWQVMFFDQGMSVLSKFDFDETDEYQIQFHYIFSGSTWRHCHSKICNSQKN